MKACWWCKQFYYLNAERGYSEMTPGGDFYIGCLKNHWEFDAIRTSEEDFGKILLTADACKDYKLKEAK